MTCHDMADSVFNVHGPELSNHACSQRAQQLRRDTPRCSTQIVSEKVSESLRKSLLQCFICPPTLKNSAKEKNRNREKGSETEKY